MYHLHHLYILFLFLSVSCLSHPLQKLTTHPLLKRTISNGPVIPSNFADPSYIELNNIFYAFSTASNGHNIPIATSPTFTSNWTLTPHDALPTLPPWTTGSIWAPDIFQLSSGLFILYFSGTSRNDTSKHCIGAATSPNILGPYTPLNTTLVCPLEEGGAIDSSTFLDPASGFLYLLWKVDGNSLGGGGLCGNGDFSHSTPIRIQRLSLEDGTTLLDSPTTILNRDINDGPLIEAPSLARSDEGVYLLFFSSNCFNGEMYDTSYAFAESVLGPYTKSKTPLLVSGGGPGGQFKSPGGADVSPDARRIVFHSDREVGNPGVREMWVGELRVNGTVVTI
ncbi:MAG: hypothetical protein Q9166_005803 [cf. Caloplaca sp. 2 TL-2023]